MAVWSVEYLGPLCGSPILPGDKLNFRVTINTWNMTPNYDFWWGIGTTENPPQSNEIQTPGPFPKTFDQVVAAPPQSTSIIFRGHEYGVPGDVDYVFPITVSTALPSVGAYACRDCETGLQTLDVEIDNGTYWGIEYYDSGNNLLSPGGIVIDPNTTTINRTTAPCQKHFPVSITNIPLDVDWVRITASNGNGTTTKDVSMETPVWSVSLQADKTIVQAGEEVTLTVTISNVTGGPVKNFEIDPIGVFVLNPEVTLGANESYTTTIKVNPTETTKYTLKMSACCADFTDDVTVQVPQTFSSWVVPHYTIPENGNIYKATLRFKCKPSEDTTVNTGPLTLRIYGGGRLPEGNVPQRITDNRVEWVLSSWTGGEWYESPDISCVLAEMRTRGWEHLYITPCAGTGFYQAYDSGEVVYDANNEIIDAAPELKMWASGIRSHTSEGGLLLGGSGTHRTTVVRSHLSEGGLLLGGSGTHHTAVIRSHTSEGGLLLGGSGTHTSHAFRSHTSIGGLLLSGSSFRRSVTPSGSLLFRRTLQLRIGTRTNQG